MLAVLRERGEVSNRDFAMHARRRIDDYRGRKDSALALHYLWRIGEVDGHPARAVRTRLRPDRGGRPAPRPCARSTPRRPTRSCSASRSPPTGLTRLSGLSGLLRRPVPAAELAERRARWLAAGDAIEVRVEGWRATQLAVGADAALIEALERGRIPTDWAPLATTTDEEASFLSPLDPVSARGRAKPLFGFDYVWEVYKPAELRSFGYYTMPILWGDRLVGRFDPKLDRSSNTLVINGLWLEDRALARDAAFGEALERGMARFVRFLGAERVDASAVSPPALRRRLTGSRRPASA